MINFNELPEIYTSEDEIELNEREKLIDFESVTNIQFQYGSIGFSKGITLSHFNIMNNALLMGANLKITD